MKLLDTLKRKWRDIVIGIALTLGIAFIADMLEQLAVTRDGAVWLANVVISLRGLAAFAGANLAAFFMVSVAWPTLNAYCNDSFASGWKALHDHQKFQTFVVVALAYLISAAICFAP